jgi:hypothetical protein
LHQKSAIFTHFSPKSGACLRIFFQFLQKKEYKPSSNAEHAFGHIFLILQNKNKNVFFAKGRIASGSIFVHLIFSGPAGRPCAPPPLLVIASGIGWGRGVQGAEAKSHCY